ncbi:MAG: flagellar protein FlaG [Magnetococcales bacterium]|nr:flagellar protein FlaG [Magnetococcales bacterium]
MESIVNILDVAGSRTRVDSGLRSGSLSSGRYRAGSAFDKSLYEAEKSLAAAEVRPEETRKLSLKGLAEEITQSLSGFNSLRFGMDRELKQVVVSVVDQGTENVIRQLPGERMVDLVKQMRDLEGMLFGSAV